MVLMFNYGSYYSNTDGTHIRCEIKILKSPRREFESFNVLFCDSQSCSAKHSKSSKINKAKKLLDQTIVQSSSNIKFVYDVKCFQITIYDVLNVCVNVYHSYPNLMVM